MPDAVTGKMRVRRYFLSLCLQTLLISSIAARHASDSLGVASFNMHGRTSEIGRFRALLQGEQVICLQEVSDMISTRHKYKDFPYQYYMGNRMTKRTFWGTKKGESGLLIVSKVPFQLVQTKHIQTDPGGDKWTRNAQHVILKLQTSGSSRNIHLFHYHNTYNWHLHNWYHEHAGMIRFVQWVQRTLGVSSLQAATNAIITGDFNLDWQHSHGMLAGMDCKVDYVDYVCYTGLLKTRNMYSTNPHISDHNAVSGVVPRTLNIGDVTGKTVRIYNTYQKEYLYAADYAPFDNYRRRVFTWRPGMAVHTGQWKLEPHNGDVRIFNTKQCEYLYAADYAPFDNDRRRVFTWRPGFAPAQSTWRIYNYRNDKLIFNLHQREFIYAGTYAPYDNDRRRVFTWRSGQAVFQGTWRFI